MDAIVDKASNFLILLDASRSTIFSRPSKKLSRWFLLQEARVPLNGACACSTAYMHVVQLVHVVELVHVVQHVVELVLVVELLLVVQHVHCACIGACACSTACACSGACACSAACS